MRLPSGISSWHFWIARRFIFRFPLPGVVWLFGLCWTRPRQTAGEGILRLTGDIRRNIAYTTNARIIKDEISANENSREIQLQLDATGGDKAFLLNITPRLGFNRWVPEPGSILQDAARRWHAWFAAAPPVLEHYQEQYYFAWWLMRAGLLSTRYYTTREVMAPSLTYYVGSWQWDNYFHALAYRHIEPHLAKDQLRILLDHQRVDGMIPDAVHDEGTVTHLDFPVDADVTKPPLIAWAAWKLFEQDGDTEFLDEIYAPIVRWNNWWFEKNDLDHNGLCEYQHPFSSGLDDSPLWDRGMPVESPDLNTYLCLQQEALAKIGEVIRRESRRCQVGQARRCHGSPHDAIMLGCQGRHLSGQAPWQAPACRHAVQPLSPAHRAAPWRDRRSAGRPYH